MNKKTRSAPQAPFNVVGWRKISVNSYGLQERNNGQSPSMETVKEFVDRGRDIDSYLVRSISKPRTPARRWETATGGRWRGSGRSPR